MDALGQKPHSLVTLGRGYLYALGEFHDLVQQSEKCLQLAKRANN